MDSFEALIAAVRSCTPEQKQQLFYEIRDSIEVHKLEAVFKVRAEIILEAISQAGDLTQRGIRGLVAEITFLLDVLPMAKGWRSDPPKGETPFDARLVKDGKSVRIQVKTQRREKGTPKLWRGSYVVEVQRTRSGQKDGKSTRPYRFGEFDLLAVCMWASTQDWHSFLYIPSKHLIADQKDGSIIRTFQPIPKFDDGEGEIWTRDLSTALQRVEV